MTDDARISAALKALDDREDAITKAMNALKTRLSQVQTAREALLALQTDEPTEFDGKLADACRIALRERHGKSMSPIEVRDRVKAIGYDLSDHLNHMAAIHGVLKRLVDSGEVKDKEWKNQPGKRYYWAGVSTTRTQDAIARLQRHPSAMTTLTEPIMPLKEEKK